MEQSRTNRKETLWSKAYPPRPARQVEPLAEASTIFPVMERMIRDAERICLLSFRIFDPHTRLRSPDMPEGLRNWGDLLAFKTAQGVDVFLLHSDFEPIGAWELHRAAWANVSHLVQRIAKQGDPSRFHAICALHHAEMGPALARVFWPVLRLHLGRHARLIRRQGGARSAEYRHSPGLWPHLEPRSESLRMPLLPLIRAWPATYHQKMMVADGTKGMIGGLDINERRFDDPRHQQAPSQTWHDVSARVEGEVACDMHRHFAECWAHELKEFRKRHTPLLKGRPPLPVNPDTLPPCPGPAASAMPEAEGQKGQVRLIRTISRRSRKPFSFGPTPFITEIADAHLEAIAAARDLIYIETQFLRSQVIAEALARRARETAHLGLIAVLPAAPEDVAFAAKRGPGERHGEWLQARALRTIGKAFGQRAGLFCLAKRESWVELAERDAVHGAGIIYSHAKVMVIDDEVAFITSANLNGRSLAWDTEAGLCWRGDSTGIRALRAMLWQGHLQKDVEALCDQTGIAASAAWQRQAGRNATLPPHEREGFILPFPVRRTRRFAARRLIVPDDMV